MFTKSFFSFLNKEAFVRKICDGNPFPVSFHITTDASEKESAQNDGGIFRSKTHTKNYKSFHLKKGKKANKTQNMKI